MAFQLGTDDELSLVLDVIQLDRQRGIRDLQLLAEAGNKSAIVCLGLYLSEEPETTADAEIWLTEAANFGSSDAAWNLAMIERERRNWPDMKTWIDRAAELGDPDAIKAKLYVYDVDRVIAEFI